MLKVTIDGQEWTRFDAGKELIELPPLLERTTIKASYAN